MGGELEYSQISSFKENARRDALKFVIDNFKRSEQLENLETTRRRVLGLKNATDVKIKAAIRFHLEGIRNGLSTLRSATKVYQDVFNNVNEIRNKCFEYKELEPKLINVKNTCCQLFCTNKALDLLAKLFEIPETIEQTKRKILEGKLLESHRSIRELENIRDHLCMEHLKTVSPEELRRLAHSQYEDWPLGKYFHDVSVLRITLKDKVMQLVENYEVESTSDPVRLVSALRIINREETVDCYWSLNKEINNGFIPSRRPYKYKEDLMNLLVKSVKSKVAYIFKEADRSDEIYVTKLLERMRSTVIKFLQNFKEMSLKLFPPDYCVLDKLSLGFHESIIHEVETLIQSLNDNSEVGNAIGILIWERDYLGKNFWGDDNINVLQTIKHAEPLLKDHTRNKLFNHYVASLYNSMTAWVTRMLDLESKDWRQESAKPEVLNNSYQTLLPTLLTQMLLPNLESAGTFNNDVKWKVFKGCLSAIESLTEGYSEAFKSYAHTHFNAKSIISGSSDFEALAMPHSENGWEFFTEYTIAVANNCAQILEIPELLCDKMKLSTGNNVQEGSSGVSIFGEENLTRIINITSSLTDMISFCSKQLVKDFMKTMTPAFENLFTKLWQQNYDAWTNGFFEAFEGFSSVLAFLNGNTRIKTWLELDYLVSAEYIKAILAKRLRFNNQDEKKELTDRMTKDVKGLVDFFMEITKMEFDEEIGCYAASICVDLLKVKDVSFVRFDLNKLCNIYEDFTEEHATHLLLARGDMNKEAVRNKVKEIEFMGERTGKRSGVFKIVTVPKGDIFSILKK